MANISMLKNSAKILTRSRLGHALFSGAKSMAASLARTFYSLWLQIVGLFAVFFTLRAGGEIVKVYRNSGIYGDPKRLWVAAAVTLFCGWFAISCFLKSRRMGKP